MNVFIYVWDATSKHYNFYLVITNRFKYIFAKKKYVTQQSQITNQEPKSSLKLVSIICINKNDWMMTIVEIKLILLKRKKKKKRLIDTQPSLVWLIKL